MSDKELLEAIFLKDESAFNTFYDRYEQLLYKWAYNRTGDINLTNEITQNFWISVWSEPSLIKTDNKGSARNFLLHHYTYRMLDYLKSSYLKIIGGDNRKDIEEIGTTLPYTHIEEEFDFKEINAIINNIIKMLPEIDRKVITLIWQEELSVKEISRHLKIDERTVNYKSRGGISFIKMNIKNLYKIADQKKRENKDSNLLNGASSGQ
ncbi:RNA polymerase sigma factor [Dysgonomonas termitidis]|uniref:RNA polymerase sigma factor n=1 Tax=Dysgonomonas termitidis TaxID=1516126 RepID=A0ABV9KV18_9BACT